MKFCQKRIDNYIHNNTETSVHFITIKDVVSFHGKEFAEQWKKFIEKKPMFKENCYYYEDYKFAARQTDSFLNPYL